MGENSILVSNLFFPVLFSFDIDESKGKVQNNKGKGGYQPLDLQGFSQEQIRI